MKLIYLNIVAFFCFELCAQNLVLNPSFEEYNNLPQPYIKTDSFFCNHWFIPDECSPDYYNQKSKYSEYCVPYNLFGFHPANSGEAYIGIVPFVYDGYMEHITGTLNQELQKDKKYIVSLYIRFGGEICQTYASNIGILFSQKKFPLQSISFPFYDNILNSEITADIKFKENVYLKDDSTWQYLSGEYIARGGEKFLTIGIFYENGYNMEKKIKKFRSIRYDPKKKKKFYLKNKDILMLNPGYIINEIFGEDNSYYFIDDVSVVEIDE